MVLYCKNAPRCKGVTPIADTVPTTTPSIDLTHEGDLTTAEMSVDVINAVNDCNARIVEVFTASAKENKSLHLPMPKIPDDGDLREFWDYAMIFPNRPGDFWFPCPYCGAWAATGASGRHRTVHDASIGTTLCQSSLQLAAVVWQATFVQRGQHDTHRGRKD